MTVLNLMVEIVMLVMMMTIMLLTRRVTLSWTQSPSKLRKLLKFELPHSLENNSSSMIWPTLPQGSGRWEKHKQIAQTKHCSALQYLLRAIYLFGHWFQVCWREGQSHVDRCDYHSWSCCWWSSLISHKVKMLLKILLGIDDPKFEVHWTFLLFQPENVFLQIRVQNLIICDCNDVLRCILRSHQS